MGKHLGSLGKYVEPTDSTFDYFDEVIRVNPDFSELDLLDFVEAGQTIDDKDPKSMTILKTFFRSLIAPDDFERFWATAKKHRQRMDALSETCNAIIAGLTDRPTQPPSVSSDGRPPTVITSTVDAWTPEGRQALTALAGRPDLQMQVLRREEALASGQ